MKGTGSYKYSRIMITGKAKLLSDEVIFFLSLSASSKTNHVHNLPNSPINQGILTNKIIATPSKNRHQQQGLNAVQGYAAQGQLMLL